MGTVLETPVYIRSCGLYLPALRVKREEYLNFLGTFAAPGVDEKAVADFDEDAVTMAHEAARAALGAVEQVQIQDIAGLYLASTTLPYAEKTQGAILGEAVTATGSIFVSEHTTSARAGTEALICAARQVALEGKPVVVVASECPRANPLDAGEHGLGAGAVALVLAREGWARVLGWYSCAREYLGVRFRATGSPVPRDLGLPQYSQRAVQGAVGEAVRSITGLLGVSLESFRLVVLPQSDGRMPFQLARAVGAKPEQVSQASLACRCGDLGSAAPLAALVTAAPVLGPGDRVLVVSWGSGQASDAVALEVTSPPVVADCSPEVRYIGLGDHIRRQTA